MAWLAKRMDIEPTECRELLRKRYDGYRFSEVSPDVYNPFSLVAALNTGKLSDYWFSSGTPTALVNMLRSSGMLLPGLEGTRATSSMFDAPTEGMDNPIACMYRSGYLTIKGYDALSDTYTLGVPNDEVEKGLYSVLLPAYSGTTSFTTGITHAAGV